MKIYPIDNTAAGQRIDRYLTKLFPLAGKDFLQKMLRKKNIKVNDAKTIAGYILTEGDVVKVFFSDETIEKFSGRRSQTRTVFPDKAVDCFDTPVYEDDDLIVINKPAGLLSQPDASGKISVSDVIPAYVPTDSATFHPAPANRLDLNTSGILLIPRNYSTQKQIAAAIREDRVIKEYLALVDGVIEREQHLTHTLVKNTKANTVKVSDDAAGKQAYLELIPVMSIGETTLIILRLHTGRSHQIRVQCAAIGHPIIGDPKYGDGTLNAVYRNAYGLKHQLLHSRHYAIPDLNYDFIAPVPDDFKKVLEGLGYPEVN